ncbi:MAG: hypothetical protein PVF43_05135 [Candidatus Eiseniibacteriota bacterium]|jgi:hypothetical protein
MADRRDEAPDPGDGLSEQDLHELIDRVFGNEELDWEATHSVARTIEDLRLLRNLYGMWKIHEFNRLVMEGEDPRDSLGPER